ncbi:endonuclease domain-containing protein [Streptomyces sp. NPDC056297]|uniref:endonuclease domain-containing protein n=1 Tax=unclassified Streptomyces TaxID=2593676 RepID=UPI0035DBCA02
MSSRISLPPPRPPKMTPERARHLALRARIAEEQRAAGKHPGQARCGRLLRDGARRCTTWPLPGLAGCARHLNDEEWQDTLDYPQAYYRDITSGCVRRTVQQQTEQRLRAAAPPACHSWSYPRALPLPDQDPVDLLVTWHADRCAACGQPSPGDLVVDHCHQSGLLRGLLCGICNTAEGTAPPRHPRWLRYRTLTPALILGVEISYSQPLRRRLAQALARPSTPATD